MKTGFESDSVECSIPIIIVYLAIVSRLYKHKVKNSNYYIVSNVLKIVNLKSYLFNQQLHSDYACLFNLFLMELSFILASTLHKVNYNK